ncbi:unnamed protein product [Euphydryas editha]|uniref:DUF7869 domain-containing protein n=2 Tax=Euphydryas editha TaxID=104508 RepID=A0AAU9U8V4_EUPED|nr:unnamed protein product [Euphydryas editha]
MNASERETIERKYLEHHEEKRLSRLEKENDKKKVDRLYVVACYDLQAVLPLPMCKTSAFYYKSKLNVCNFTICDLARDYCECYVWSEVDGLRGANEIGSCVFLYIKNKAEMLNDDNLQLIFYSDNCCGQQKNQYMFCMYLYALCNYKIQSITHKFLITGHTQNENDNVHSVIEKQVKKFLKSSPIYIPEQFITLIKTARKTGVPYNVKEMSYWDFYDLKHLVRECGKKFNKNTEGDTRDMIDDGELQQLYNARIELSTRKKSDLKSLVDNNLIPRYYANSFYNNIL